MHAYRGAVLFFQQGCWNRYKPVLPSSIAIGTENGSWHWRPWRLDSRIELVNEPRRGERRSLRNDNCALAGRRSGTCGPRKKISRLFSKTLSSPAVLFPDVFFTGLCGFRFAEERRTFADMWTSLDTFSFRAACAQKCLRQQFWAFFYTSLWQARTVGPVFPAVLFPVAFLDFLCTDRQVYVQEKKDRACWSSELYLGFVSTKEKLVYSYKTIHGEKVKSDQKTLCTCHRISGYVLKPEVQTFVCFRGREGFQVKLILFVLRGFFELLRWPLTWSVLAAA